MELRTLLQSLRRLTAGQRAELLTALGSERGQDEVRALVEARLQDQPACPHCAGLHIVRNGSASGLQRYKCRGCRRTFNALSTTPLAGLRLKPKWLGQQDVLQQGLGVKQAAAQQQVAPSTAFRWRHRFLKLAKPVKASALSGVVEADETFFLRSRKGQRAGRPARERGGRASRKDRGIGLIPVPVAHDRSGATVGFLLEAGVQGLPESGAQSPPVQ